MKMSKKYFEMNKAHWDASVAYHVDSILYDMEAFLRGRSSLNSIELDEVGEVKGKKLLHLQCHFGQDSISWSRMGASVTAIDFSPKAISKAREIAGLLKEKVRFIECNLYDLPKHLSDQFDIVFTSYGTIIWLPDLMKWAELIYNYLRPGGFFYIVDFHPVLLLFDLEKMEIKYPYFNSGPIEEELQGTYAEPEADISGVEYCWSHSFSELFKALMDQGLIIESFNEHRYSPYNCFPNLVETAKGEYQLKGLAGKIPYLFSLKVRKPDK